MKKDFGLFIERLTVSGPGLPDAVLNFGDGLNILSGSSNSGKSYAFQCLDYALGAGKTPKPIAEAKGYQTVTLRVFVRAEQNRYDIERSLAGGDAILRLVDSSGKLGEPKILAEKHSPTNPLTISGQLLAWTQLSDKTLRTNKEGARRTLSFRDVAHLSLVDEIRIFGETAPHITPVAQTKTAMGDLLRLLVTGHETPPVVKLATRKEIARSAAQTELLAEMIKAAESEFARFEMREEEIADRLAKLEAARVEALTDYDQTRSDTVRLEQTVADFHVRLRETQARAVVVEALVQRFALLRAHYDSDLQRLQAIEETGTLLESFSIKACSVCGADSAHHRSDQCAPEFTLANVQDAARAERLKIVTLRTDLEKVLAELGAEAIEHSKVHQEAVAGIQQAEARLAAQLMPRIRHTSDSLRSVTDARDRIIQAQTTLSQLQQLRDLAAPLEAIAATSPGAPIDSSPTSGELNAFAAEVEVLLRAWNYPTPGRVVFSEDAQDLVIGEQIRTAHGKGVRALTCSAFLLGLSRYCQTHGLPHPTFVVLDSPLLAYKPSERGAESAVLEKAGVKEAFYSTLATGLVPGQVIVLENQDPPSDLPHDRVVQHHFTGPEGPTSTRKGFFPPRT